MFPILNTVDMLVSTYKVFLATKKNSPNFFQKPNKWKSYEYARCSSGFKKSKT